MRFSTGRMHALVSAPRSRRALGFAYAAAPLAGVAGTLAGLRHPVPALIAALIAAALVISALVWALKQEVRR